MGASMASMGVTGPAQPVASRPFQLVDAMILTAGAALALTPPSRDFITHIPSKLQGWVEWSRHLAGRRIIPSLVGLDAGSMLARDVVTYLSGLMTNPLIGLTLALIWIRLRRPRPPGRAIARQPGFAACAAALVGFFLGLEASYLLGAAVRPELAVGAAVGATWVALLVTRRWAAEPGWIDRLGRGVGLGWIAVALGVWFQRSF